MFQKDGRSYKKVIEECGKADGLDTCNRLLEALIKHMG